MRPDDFDALYAIASDPLLWEQHPSKNRTERSGFQKWFDDAMTSGGALVAIDRTDGSVIETSRFDQLRRCTTRGQDRLDVPAQIALGRAVQS